MEERERMMGLAQEYRERFLEDYKVASTATRRDILMAYHLGLPKAYDLWGERGQYLPDEIRDHLLDPWQCVCNYHQDIRRDNAPLILDWQFMPRYEPAGNEYPQLALLTPYHKVWNMRRVTSLELG